jgi:D-glycero-alpha-D-manno-heptose-7-phosphate kinase
VLGWLNCERGLEIHHDGDLPARSGLGSSSSFTVGLLNALSALDGRHVSKEELAKTAIHIEQNVIQENVGSQDQISAAYGGFNRIDFRQNDSFDVQPIILPREQLEKLEGSLMLFFTGFSRIASDVAKSKIENLKNRLVELERMREMVDEGMNILRSPNTSLDEFGKLLHESWACKRSLSDQVSTPDIDHIYEEALRAGATGGKLMGAGGGGFMVLFVRPELQEQVRLRLSKLICVPFKFDSSGSRVVLYHPDGWS